MSILTSRGKKSARIKLAAMDMWKPFRNSVIHNAPNARVIFDKFHIMRHLSKAVPSINSTSVGSRAGAVLRRRGLSVSPHFLWEFDALDKQPRVSLLTTPCGVW